MIQIHQWGAAKPQKSFVQKAGEHVSLSLSLCVCLWVCWTLRADQDQRQVGRVSVVGEAAEVVINRLEADLVLQTEDEDHSVDPQCKLQRQSFKYNFIYTCFLVVGLHYQHRHIQTVFHRFIFSRNQSETSFNVGL